MCKKKLSRLCTAGLAALLSVTAAFPSFALSELQEDGPGFEDTFEDSGRDAYEAGRDAAGDASKVTGKEGVSEIIVVGLNGDTVTTSSSPASQVGTQGTYLGRFKVTGYCNCPKCCSGSGLTYSGTVPRANHTIAADLSVYPLGTKLMCEGIIYTVEDCGSNVDGNTIDIYFDDHDLAFEYGTQYHDVYAVE